MKAELEKLKSLIESGTTEGMSDILTSLQSSISTEDAKKVTAVGEIKRLKDFKNSVQSMYGVEAETSLADVLTTVTDTFKNTQTSLNQYKETNTGKETELETLKRLVNETQNQMSELTTNYNSEKKTNEMNNIKSNFRKELSSKGIKDASAQDLVINANLAAIETVEDLGSFADQIAKSNPYLTQSNHKRGFDTGLDKEITVTSSLADCKTPQDREAYYQKQVDEGVE